MPEEQITIPLPIPAQEKVKELKRQVDFTTALLKTFIEGCFMSLCDSTQGNWEFDIDLLVFKKTQEPKESENG